MGPNYGTCAWCGCDDCDGTCLEDTMPLDDSDLYDELDEEDE